LRTSRCLQLSKDWQRAQGQESKNGDGKAGDPARRVTVCSFQSG
jgi:hypothetical protein